MHPTHVHRPPSPARQMHLRRPLPCLQQATSTSRAQTLREWVVSVGRHEQAASAQVPHLQAQGGVHATALAVPRWRVGERRQLRRTVLPGRAQLRAGRRSAPTSPAAAPPAAACSHPPALRLLPPALRPAAPAEHPKYFAAKQDCFPWTSVQVPICAVLAVVNCKPKVQIRGC